MPDAIQQETGKHPKKNDLSQDKVAAKSCTNRYLGTTDMQEPAVSSLWWETMDDASLFQRGNRPMYSAHWSVAWSDLMMTMFILFLVMFVYKTTGHEFLSRSQTGKQAIIKSADGPMIPRGLGDGHGGQSAEEIRQAFSRQYDFSQLVIDQDTLHDFAAIDLTRDKTIRIILTGDLLFDAGLADLKPAALASLNKIATLIIDTPYKINVLGHTDDQSINSTQFPSNWELSAARAGAVARFLITATNLPPQQFEISGQACFHPIVNNNTKKNRAKNRRVEIIISRQGDSAQQFTGNRANIKPTP